MHCWEPIKIEREIIRKYQLPTYSIPPYQYQKEFSIFGGILPHFISGLEIIPTNDFFPNPNIFSGDINKELFFKGFDINQINFNEIAQQTNYKRSFASDGVSIWEK